MSEDDGFGRALAQGRIAKEPGGRLRLKAKACRWCKGGNFPNEDGDHWIVKSIIPAKISIYKCSHITFEDR